MTEEMPLAAESLDGTVARGVQTLLAAQHVRGQWQGSLEGHASLEAEMIFLFRLLGRDERDLEQRLAERLASTQRSDGGWSLGPEGAPDLSVTVEAYYALRLAGRTAEEPILTRAREFVLAHGGLAAASVSTRLWLALFGQYPWSGVPALPVEMVLLPTWSPLGIHAVAWWLRTAIVPVALLLAHRDAIGVREAVSVTDLWVHHPPRPDDLAFPRSAELVTWRNALLLFERALAVVARRPWEPLRRRAVARAIEWLLRHQDANGQWGGNLPATLYALLALHAVGFAPDHPVMVSGLGGARDFLVDHGRVLLAQPALSAVHDTARAAGALLDAGLEPSHPALVRAAEWLTTNQVFRPGDWAIARPGLEPGGWPGGIANDWYPETAVSAEVLAVLAALPGEASPARRRAHAYGVHWLLGMQGRSGGWAVCDPDGPAAALAEVPFAPEEIVTDGAMPDVTGRVLVGLAATGFGPELRNVRRAIEFLRRTQRPDGSWPGRAGALHATWCALAGLAAVGELGLAEITRAGDWLTRGQRADGGWRESTVEDSTLASSPVHTAWALLALLATDAHAAPAIESARAYLVRAQRPDGTWEEPCGTAPGFGRCRTFREPLAATCYVLSALGRTRGRWPAEPRPGRD